MQGETSVGSIQTDARVATRIVIAIADHYDPNCCTHIDSLVLIVVHNGSKDAQQQTKVLRVSLISSGVSPRVV